MNDPLGHGQIAIATDRPTSIEELGMMVAARAAEGHAIYPQGGRTALEYGGTPSRRGVAIDLRGLDRVVDYPVADMTITVEAGITLDGLQAVLAAQGQRLDVEAPTSGLATLGGIYATNTSGPRRYGYGRPRDQIIGVRFVNARGETIKGGGRVVKNVAGYDFPKLMTGSMGTLGIIAEMTLKVRPIPETSAICTLRFPGLREVASALNSLNTSGTRPVLIELSHRQETGWLLHVGFEGNRAAVAWQVDRLAMEFGSAEMMISEEPETVGKSLVEAQIHHDPTPTSFVASLKPSSAIDFLAKVNLDRWLILVHAGNGIVRGHSSGAGEPDIPTLRAEVERRGGSMILPHAIDRRQVWGTPRADWALAAQVKHALDPGGVMNPGRFLDFC